MIICSASNIDLIQGTLGYGDTTEGVNITDWRISNTQSAIAGQSGVFNIFNSSSITPSISIVDSGTVGIGTVPSVSSASKMEIVGNVNITGAYNINNRNVIADTSNYVLSTSNALVSRINASGGSGGALTSGGNLTLSNNATSNTVLSIQNNFTSNYTSNYTSNVVTGSSFVADFTGAGNTAPSVHEAVSGSTTERIMIFRTANVNHTFTVPAGGLACDILMIGGGGGSGTPGGGAGACIIAINQTLPAGSCVVNVGDGGNSSSGNNGSGSNGNDSFIKVDNTDRYRAKGGGRGGSNGEPGNEGGCGGGAGFNLGTIKIGGVATNTNMVNGSLANIGPSITSTYAVMGNDGGNNGTTSGSGGGIGAAGVTGGKGGDGAYQVTLTTSPTTTINFRNYFANGGNSFGVLHTDNNYYIGGGGGGYNGSSFQAGGLGGGGGMTESVIANTGSGAGSFNNNNKAASGIIIIRYRSSSTTTTPIAVSSMLSTPPGTPTIELIRGISGDTNTDYKLGNYDGNFKIMSSISSIDTDRLSINSSGNLSLSNNATNSTAISIINSNITIATTPATGGLVSALTTTGSPTIGTIGTTDRYMIFTASGSFTVPTGGINCDILMIGGGGAGGYNGGGGGGAGACIVAINQTLSTAGLYTVNVGAGDTQNSTATGAGGDSSIVLSSTTLYLAKGGGRGEIQNSGRNNGGCGGGSGYGTTKTGGTTLTTNIVNGIITGPTLSSTFVVLGNKGGDRVDTSSSVTGAGGGGIGGPGGNHILNSINAGPGGVGVNQVAINGITYNFKSYFAGGTTFGNNNDGFIGGGGGGSVYTNTASAGPNTGGLGGVGGGGKGGIFARTNPDGTSLGSENGVSGTANTGGGGGGAYLNTGIGGNGGSGIVIVRYRVATAVVGVPSVELIRGVAGDSNHDYKVGNYDGNFKIMSSVSGATDAERINITSVGNVGIGTSSPANELHIFDSTTSATSLIIQNNNMMMTSNTTQGTSTVTGSVTTGGITTSEVQYIATFSTYGPSTHAQVTSSTDRYMIFTTASVNHTFTIPSGDINCDILMIGGGGGGGRGYDFGADLSGGGAGACIVSINQKLPAGTCVVRVGAGGPTNTNGVDSFIQVDNVDRYRAKGGGGGSHRENNSGVGLSGGCGGGATWTTDNGAVNNGGAVVSTNTVTINDGTTNTLGPYISDTHRFAVMGNAGGVGSMLSGQYQAAGGGGGIAGGGGFRSGGGNGKFNVLINGTTYNFRDWFANGGAFGADNGYIGGGGAANSGGYYSGGLGGGGGAQRVASYNTPSPGAANTGSGGSEGGSGGSGIVIIRYRYKTVTETVNTTVTTTTYTHTPTSTTTLTTTLGTPSIELVRGTQGDSNTDYKIGNYSGDFIVKSSVSGVDSDYIRMLGTNGAIYNFTNSLYWTQTSDRRIKENIARASYDMCYDNIDKLELNRFNYIKEFNTGNKDTNQLGFIAQEIKEIFPKAVFTNNYSGGDLNIQDMLSIDIGQINYTLYGAVKKLMEINKDKELRLKRLEGLLNIEDGSGSSGSNVVVDSSNVVVDSSDTSNITIDTSNLLDTSNITIDTSNLLDTSNIVIDTSNIAIDTISNIAIDTSNIAIDTSNITIDTSNVVIDSSSNVLIDITPYDILSSNLNI